MKYAGWDDYADGIDPSEDELEAIDAERLDDLARLEEEAREEAFIEDHWGDL